MKLSTTDLCTKRTTGFLLLRAACGLVAVLPALADHLSLETAKPFGTHRPTNLATGTFNRDLGFGFAVADFNQDGRNDLITITFDPTNNTMDAIGLRVYLQGADHQFTNTGDYAVSDATGLYGNTIDLQLIAKDFNEDGHLDVLVEDFGNAGRKILLGKGDGTFNEPQSLGLSIYGHFTAVADVNGDHHADFVAEGSQPGVTLFRGQGDGAFIESTPLETTGAPGEILIGDLNQDGRPDVAVATLDGASQKRSVEVFLQNSDQTFQPAIVTPLESAAGLSAVLIDLNADGRLDYAATDPAGGRIEVWLGQGDGHFLKRNPVLTAGSPRYLASGDVNGDGIPDLVADSSDSGAPATVFLGKGDGTFQALKTYSPGTNRQAIWPRVADLNTDGFPDLVMFGLHEVQPNTLHVAYGQAGATGFSAGTLLNISGETPRSVIVDTSDNLVDWSPWATNNTAVANWRLVDDAVGKSQRFYRVR